MLRLLLLMTIAAATRASHLSSYEGHGLVGHPKLISQSVHLNEVPTKVIKVTKVVAVKVPVLYPVKVPQAVPYAVPVNHPVAVPYPQIVKVPHHVPVEVEKPVPIPIHQQVPVVVAKPIALPQPVPVPHAVAVPKPVYYPVPHPIPYHSEGHSAGGGGDDYGYGAGRYAAYAADHSQGHGGYEDDADERGDHFEPSQPDYSGGH